MSWNKCIDKLVEQAEGNCDQGCIFSFDNGDMWTSGPKHLEITPADAKVISEKWKDPKAMVDHYGLLNGITALTVADGHYRLLRADDQVAHFIDKEKGRIDMQKTKRAIIAAHTPQDRNPDKTLKAVVAFGDYVTNNGY